ncbi:Podocalyxin [Sciurus carolinensis]|uniref:Podocalyxin n=1 Tax=Sciurus carolinensis TaxID=30640 RepID=A0AA41NDW6_SCICA|nr:Podocalyxin [Sciurus carolinensis]
MNKTLLWPSENSYANGALLGEGAEAGADGTGRESSQSPAGQQTRRHRPDAAAAAPLPLALRPSPALRQGGGAARARLRSTGPPPGLGSHRQASRSGPHVPAAQTHRPCASPAATCFGPRGEDRMRYARALSALLLLLLLLPPSLSQDAAADQTRLQSAAPSQKPTPTASPGAPKTSATVTTHAAPTHTSPNPKSPTASTGKAEAQTPAQSGPADKASVPTVKEDLGNPTGALSGSQGSSIGPPASTASASTEATSLQDGDKGATVPADHKSSHAPTHPSTTQRTDQLAPHSSVSVRTEPPPMVSHASPASSAHSTVTAKTPASSPEEGHDLTTVPSGSSLASGTGSPTVRGMPTTPTSSVTTIAPQGTGQTSGQMPTSPTPSSSTTLQPRDSSSSPVSGTVATPAVGGDTHFSTPLASTVPQGLSTPYSTLAPGKPKVDCVTPEKLDEKLLILNLTETSPCVSAAHQSPHHAPAGWQGKESRGDRSAPSQMGRVVSSSRDQSFAILLSNKLRRKMENPESLPDTGEIPGVTSRVAYGGLEAGQRDIRSGSPDNLPTLIFTAKSPPADDKLVTQLCRAVKATFNPAQDSCTVQLAPIQESQAVAIKKITIQTNLLPENVYELLKDKWDDLREVGVSHMQLGNEGPPEEAEDRFSMPLIITIVCMASFLLLVAALYGCCHQRLSQRKDQQRLTEELQTVENGYHDNPTLEVMETSSEMQEKKVVNLNGELGDSWIVPLDNLTKDDLDEEEDTHL